MNEPGSSVAMVHSLISSVFAAAKEFGAGDMVNAAVFYGFAGIVVLAALGVVLCRNIVHSALLLTASFIGIGCLYIFLEADFMGAVQIMVYGGAVAVLTVLAIMLIRRENDGPSNPSRGILHQMTALIPTASFLLLMAVVIMLTPFRIMPVGLGDSAEGLAELMFTKYMFPFEVAAVLLLMALVGAIVLAKGADDV